jgi:hypothetical protein
MEDASMASANVTEHRTARTLTLHGRPVQHATAYGTYGRAIRTTNLTTPTSTS